MRVARATRDGPTSHGGTRTRREGEEEGGWTLALATRGGRAQTRRAYRQLRAGLFALSAHVTFLGAKDLAYFYLSYLHPRLRMAESTTSTLHQQGLQSRHRLLPDGVFAK